MATSSSPPSVMLTLLVLPSSVVMPSALESVAVAVLAVMVAEVVPPSARVALPLDPDPAVTPI